MRFTQSALSRCAAGLFLSMSFALNAQAETAMSILENTVTTVEAQLDGRVGVVIRQIGQDELWSWRGDERFVMTSTFKVPLCGAILAAAEKGQLHLEQEIAIHPSDLIPHAPVTEQHLDAPMSIADLCLATIDMSDNTAANLLIETLGGPEAVTAFFRSIGDNESRLDRYEPELNLAAEGDLRDTTTPLAMAETLEALLFGDQLSNHSRALLADWMGKGGVTATLLRDKLPQGWTIYDKSGGGSNSRSLIAVATSADETPWVISIYLADMEQDFSTRTQALQSIAAAVANVIKNELQD